MWIFVPVGKRKKKALRYEKKNKSDDDNSMETRTLKFRFESVIDSMALAKLPKCLLCHSSFEYKIGIYHSCLKWAMNSVFAKWFLPMQDRKWYPGLFIHLNITREVIHFSLVKCSVTEILTASSHHMHGDL